MAAMAALMVEREIDGGDGGDGGLNSRACLRILMVEREIDGGDGGPYGRARNPSPSEW